MQSPNQLSNIKNDFQFSIDYLGEDTLNTISIANIDSLKLYRIKSSGDPESLHFASPFNPPTIKAYYIDSSIDGGQTWSKKHLISLQSFSDVKMLKVSKDLKSKYLITNNEIITLAGNWIEEKRFYESFFNFGYSSILNIFYNPETDVFEFLTPAIPGTKYHYLHNKQEKVIDLNTTEINIFDRIPYTVDNDTTFVLYQTLNHQVGIEKIDTSGKVIEQKETKINFEKKNYQFFVKSNNYLFSRDTSWYYSSDYGNTWNKDVINDSIFLYNYYSDSGILLGIRNKASFAERYGKSFCLDLKTHSLTNFSDSCFIFNSENKVYALENSSSLFFSSRDIKKGTEKLYKLTRSSNIKIEPKVTHSEVKELNDNIFIEIKIDNKRIQSSVSNLILLGSTLFDYNENNKLKFLSSAWIPNKDSTSWSTSFSPTQINLHKGDPYRLQIYFSNNTLENRYDIDLTYEPSKFSEEHPYLYIILLVFGIVFSILYLCYFFAPYSLYFLNQKLSVIETILPILDKNKFIAELIKVMFIIPLFAKTNRVAKKWAIRNKSLILDYYKKETTVINHFNQNTNILIPLKILGQSNVEIEKPLPNTLFNYFQSERTCIEIIGRGGIGKTTLAINIGLWTSDFSNNNYFKHLWLPILIEEDTTELFRLIHQKLNVILNNKIEESFVRFLLRKKFLLIIFDALSEKNSSTQEAVIKIYRTHDINALITTSRKELNIQRADKVYFLPQEMQVSKLYEYLNKSLLGKGLNIFETEADTAELLAIILRMFRVNDTKIPLLPILTEVIVNKIIKETNNYKSIPDLLIHLPNSIPEMISDYIIRVNPKEGQNLFSDNDVLRCAEVVADVILEDKFMPREITLTSIINKTKEDNPLINSNIINRLIDNGVLVSRRYGNDEFIKYAFDPFAEFMCAFYKAKQCNNKKENWVTLYRNIKASEAYEFFEILKIIQIVYAEKYNWILFENLKDDLT